MAVNYFSSRLPLPSSYLDSDKSTLLYNTIIISISGLLSRLCTALCYLSSMGAACQLLPHRHASTTHLLPQMTTLS